MDLWQKINVCSTHPELRLHQIFAWALNILLKLSMLPIFLREIFKKKKKRILINPFGVHRKQKPKMTAQNYELHYPAGLLSLKAKRFNTQGGQFLEKSDYYVHILSQH